MPSLSIKPLIRVSNLGLKITPAAIVTPMLTTGEAKSAARIDFSDDDTFIDALVEAATLWAENYLNRGLITRSFTCEWDSVGAEVPLPLQPVVSITSVKVVNEENTKTALTLNSGYFLRNGTIKVSTPLGLEVIYTCGYGAASSNVPSPIKRAIERIVIGLYDRRDDEMDATNIDQLALNSVALLNPYINHVQY